MGKLSKDRRDIYYRNAKEEGYRARSAYKLLHLNEEFNIFSILEKQCENNQYRIVDLCAAPGSWSQVVSKLTWDLYEKALNEKKQINVEPPLIVAVDLQKIYPIPNVITIQGDITCKETADLILSYFKGKKAQLVLCDGAPDVTGSHEVDEFIQSQLLFCALRMAVLLLETNGIFISKIFRGEMCGLIYSQLELLFKTVTCCKPASSRVSSYEAFVICQGFQYPFEMNEFDCSSQSAFENALWNIVGFNDKNKLSQKLNSYNEPATTCSNFEKNLMSSFEKLNLHTVVPFLACGDLSAFDADTTYALKESHSHLEPTQSPLDPPYQKALLTKRNALQ